MGETFESTRTGQIELADGTSLAAMAPTATGLPDRLIEAIVDYARAAKAENTWRAYEADLRHFAAWCETQGLSPLPAAPATVAAYLADCARP
jgi:hypothetical protein